MFSPRGLILTGILVLAAGFAVLAGVHGCMSLNDPTEETNRLVQDVQAASHPYESGLGQGSCKAYRALFSKVGSDGVRKLLTHPDDSIAIQAAWEEVALTVPERERRFAVRPDAGKLTWFLGFLEERGRVQPPPWWAEMVLDSGANRRDNIYPGNPKESPYHDAGLDLAQAPLDTSLKKEGNQVLLKVGSHAVRIPESLLEKTDRGTVLCGVSALVTPTRCYLAVHGDVGYPYPVACIDRSTAKVVWKSEVWGTWWGGATGIHFMWVAVTEQNDRIVVFGAGTTGIHVEAFRPDNGKNVFRFSSSY
jgi:hypothetical protein